MNPDDSNQKQDTAPVRSDSGIQNQPPVISGVSKEREAPFFKENTIEEPAEFQVPKEVSEHIKLLPTKPDIPPDLIKAGVTHSPADDSVQQTRQDPSLAAPVPLSDDQINQGIAKAPTDSVRWLAEWCVKQLKLAHVQLKKVKGRYIRVQES